MHLYPLISVLVCLTALFAYVNDRFIRLQTSIGVMLIGLLFSLALLLLGHAYPPLRAFAGQAADQIQFQEALLQWMLGFLLFSGALAVDVEEFLRQGGAIALLSTLGTLISMFVVAGLSYGAVKLIGLQLSWIDCLTFGALISPTDPVAVLAIFKSVGAPGNIQAKVAGESLFNDGVGVVLFTTLLAVQHASHASDASAPTPGWVVALLLRQGVGGIGLGIVLGIVGYTLIRRTRDQKVYILLTLALVMGGYALGEALHVSGPLAIVAAGIFIGNRGGGRFTLPHEVGHAIDEFWELLEELLNAILFLMVGLAVLKLPFDRRYLLAIALLIPGTLIARFLSVAAIIAPLSLGRTFARHTISILTWGGLRGGLAVAMALSLPPSPARDTILAITYGVVIFSIAVQGTTIRALVVRCVATPAASAELEAIGQAGIGGG